MFDYTLQIKNEIALLKANKDSLMETSIKIVSDFFIEKNENECNNCNVFANDKYKYDFSIETKVRKMFELYNMVGYEEVLYLYCVWLSIKNISFKVEMKALALYNVNDNYIRKDIEHFKTVVQL